MDNDTKKAVAASLREVAAKLLKPIKASIVMAADTKRVFKDALTGKELDWAEDEQLQRAVEVAKEAAAEVSREIPGIREALEAIRKELTKRVAASAAVSSYWLDTAITYRTHSLPSEKARALAARLRRVRDVEVEVKKENGGYYVRASIKDTDPEKKAALAKRVKDMISKAAGHDVPLA